MAERKLRVGLMLDDLVVPHWVGEIVSMCLAEQEVEIALLLINAQPPPRKRRPLLQVLRSNNFLYNRYQRLEQRRLRHILERYPAADLAQQLAAVPHLFVVPQRSRHTDVLSTSDVSLVRSFNLDIILRFGFRILRGEILEGARYGIWSYHHGDNDFYRGGPPGFWEVYEQNPVSGVTLQVLTDTLDGGYILCKSSLRTHAVSPLCNQENLLYSGVSLFQYALRPVLRDRPSREEFFGRLEGSLSPYHRKIFRTPTNREMIPFLISHAPRYIRARIEARAGREQWSIGICDVPPLELANVGFDSVNWYEPPDDRFVADPFVIERNGVFVFVEEFNYEAGKGVISVLEYRSDGSFSPLEKVIEEPFHLSYPFVFEHDGQILMVPEAAESNEVILYECVEFPRKWRRRCTLIEGFAGIDSTLLQMDERWWLFTSDASFENYDNNLHLFTAYHLEGPYRPHPTNPVKCGIASSRMAGRIFSDGTRLIRPAQNCSRRYGGSIVFNEIEILNEREYRERERLEVFMNRSARFGQALHTVNRSEQYTVIDGSRFIRRRR